MSRYFLNLKRKLLINFTDNTSAAKKNELLPLAIEVKVPDKKRLTKSLAPRVDQGNELAPLAMKNKRWHHQLQKLSFGTTRNDYF